MIIKIKSSILCYFLLAVSFIYSQTDNNKNNHRLRINIPEVALINVQSSTNADINFGNGSVVEAGQALKINETDDSIWINYSSIVGSNSDASRNVTIQISEGTVPNGLDLFVKAGKDKGYGGGKMGKPIEIMQLLTTTPLNIVTKIGSAYTGVGPRKGHNILYTLKLKKEKGSYGQLDFDQTTTLVINYTLSDH